MKTKLKTYKSRLVFALVVSMVSSVSFAATFSDANWISMGGLPGADDSVYAAVVDGSGNLYIGGMFTVVGDVIANRVAKWNGSSWRALGSGIGDNLNDRVLGLAVSGSDLYAGGQFRTAGGSAAQRKRTHVTSHPPSQSFIRDMRCWFTCSRLGHRHHRGGNATDCKYY